MPVRGGLFCRRKEKTVIKKDLKVKTEDVVGLLNLFPTLDSEQSIMCSTYKRALRSIMISFLKVQFARKKVLTLTNIL